MTSMTELGFHFRREKWDQNFFFSPMDLFLTSRMCQIEKGLYLGSFGDAKDWNQLRSFNVTHILTLADLRPEFPNKIVYKIVDVMDTGDTQIKDHFDECIDFIDEAQRLGGNVLVHCMMGVSRSVTVVVAYLMKRRHMTLLQALEHVKRKRRQASPNSGFLRQLAEFERSLWTEQTREDLTESTGPSSSCLTGYDRGMEPLKSSC